MFNFLHTLNWFVKSPQFKRGMKVEAFLDRFFRSRGFTIKKTSRHQERVLCLGDRIYTDSEGKSYFVEYKSGVQTLYTGNVFLETVSVDTTGKLGWVYTCEADYLFYATLLNGCILIFEPKRLRGVIEGLKKKFPEKSTSKNQNQGYNTIGVLVPFEYAKSNLASKVVALK